MTKADIFMNAVISMQGTPFVHQGRTPGIALDCAGVVVCGAEAAGIYLPDQKAYPTVPDGDRFVKTVESCCDKIRFEAVSVADLMMFTWGRRPQHIAVVSHIDPIRIIHSWNGSGGVVENSLDEFWLRKLRGCYRLRGLN